jgi:hypothetical protein
MGDVNIPEAPNASFAPPLTKRHTTPAFFLPVTKMVIAIYVVALLLLDEPFTAPKESFLQVYNQIPGVNGDARS